MACMKTNCIIFLGKNRQLVMSVSVLAMAFFLFLPSTHCMAQGRMLSKFYDDTVSANEESWVVKMRSVIGSRPPRCKEKCNSSKSCGHCEAIQIPILPQQLINIHRITPRVAYSRGDDITNYKPMCWKCKCGDFIFNP